jgi:DNA-binding winged helix-turn-helix (wHTH) protein
MPDPDSARPDQQPARRYRFGVFEADAATGELRRQGLRLRLNAQPFQLLLLLLERPGQLLTREEIAGFLWPDGTFVDYEHGVNSAINRIREALGDTAGSPRFVETLARRGYRFIAPVEKIDLAEQIARENRGDPINDPDQQQARNHILATANDLPSAPHHLVQAMFLLFQLMYLAFYISALANLGEIESLLKPLTFAEPIFYAILVTAAILIPVRAFALCAALFRAPRFRDQFLKLWSFLLIFDELWALSPFLLLHHINYGLAIACMALLVYSPFAQRAIVLMGAGSRTAKR